MKLSTIHFAYGLVLLFIFFVTGAYMHFEYNHMAGVADGPRMMYRTSHIFILMLAAMNIIYSRINQPYSIFNKIETSSLLIAPLLFIYSFFSESLSVELHRPASKYGIYLVLVIISCEAISKYQKQ